LIGFFRVFGHGLSISFRRVTKQDVFELRGSVLWMTASKIATLGCANMDSLILAKIQSLGAVTELSLTRRAPETVVHMAGRLSLSSNSGLAHLTASRTPDETLETTKILFHFIFYAALIGMTIAFILNPIFTRLWAGSESYAGPQINALICIYGLIKLFRLFLANLAFSRGNIRISSISVMIEAALQLSLGLILCATIGMAGLVIASIVGSTLSCNLLLRRAIHVSERSMLSGVLRSTWKQVTLIVVLGILISILLRHLKINKWTELMILVTGSVVFFNAVLLLIDTEFRRSWLLGLQLLSNLWSKVRES
jgi:O-antigen/teichoic acid export membrane protein